jgi:cystathionine gamma-synthase
MSQDTPSIVRRTALPQSASDPVVTPIYPSVVYRSLDADALDAQYEDANKGYTYAREGHPNAEVLAHKLNGLEGAAHGLITGSGMSAIGAVLYGLLKSGDRIVAGNQLYGRSLRLLTQDLPRMGIETTFVDPTDTKALQIAITPDTSLVLLELVSNPTLRLADIETAITSAKAADAIVAIDNTFTTPRAYNPLSEGADIVIHSVTKLLAGHSDATLGYVGTNNAALAQQMNDFAVTMGLTASPFDCWLAERGLHSFELRYDRAEASAKAIADALADAPGLKRVLYPSRADHPDHNKAQHILGARGGHMVSFELEGGRETANAFIRAASDIPFAPTLGDIGCTLSHPASSSHRALSEADRAKLGISEGFFRLSVGIEDVASLKTELLAAINAAYQHG